MLFLIPELEICDFHRSQFTHKFLLMKIISGDVCKRELIRELIWSSSALLGIVLFRSGFGSVWFGFGSARLGLGRGQVGLSFGLVGGGRLGFRFWSAWVLGGLGFDRLRCWVGWDLDWVGLGRQSGII